MSTYAFDIDGTLCRTHRMNYASAQPIPSRIALVNALHAAGHTIRIYTARGWGGDAERRQRLVNLTRKQLDEWGVKYHTLHLKPAADHYIDDRAQNAAHFFGGHTDGA